MTAPAQPTPSSRCNYAGCTETPTARVERWLFCEQHYREHFALAIDDDKVFARPRQPKRSNARAASAAPVRQLSPYEQFRADLLFEQFGRPVPQRHQPRGVMPTAARLDLLRELGTAEVQIIDGTAS